jgi:hypothetical protein
VNKCNLIEAINSVSELEAKLRPLSELEIFKFMYGLHPGTFFNMGMYSMIPVASAYKDSIFIYKVINMTAIVSGVDYENISTTKDFRDRTGKAQGSAWYDHMPGYEHKVGVKRSDQTSKYVLWNIKESSDNWVRFYLVDSDTNTIKPVSKLDLENCPYLTPGTKSKLDAGEKSKGVDSTTGQVIENQTNWRTAAFTHIFWLSQNGVNTSEYGLKFVEGKDNMKKCNLEEAGSPVFKDLHAGIHTDLDAFFNGAIEENCNVQLKEDTQQPAVFIDITGSNTYQRELEAAAVSDGHKGNADWYYTKDTFFSDVLDYASQGKTVFFYTADDDYAHNCPELIDMANVTIKQIKPRSIKESYRRTVSRGTTLVDNELFIDFD